MLSLVDGREKVFVCVKVECSVPPGGASFGGAQVSQSYGVQTWSLVARSPRGSPNPRTPGGSMG